MRSALPWDSVSMDATIVSDVATSVGFRISIKDFFVPTFARSADSIRVSRHWSRIDYYNDGRSGFGTAQECHNAIIRIMKIDPLLPLNGQCALIFLRPILAGVGKPKMGGKLKNSSSIDEYYEAVRQHNNAHRRPAHCRVTTDVPVRRIQIVT